MKKRGCGQCSGSLGLYRAAAGRATNAPASPPSDWLGIMSRVDGDRRAVVMSI
jgi:hypothetical protein